MTVQLLTEHHLEFLSLKGGCTGSSESSPVKMPHCLKSHVTAQMMKEAIYLLSAAVQLKMITFGLIWTEPILTLLSSDDFSQLFSLDQNQTRHFVGPGLGQNCLLYISADDPSRVGRVKQLW